MAENRITEEAGDDPRWVRQLKSHDDESPQQLWGVVAEYRTPKELMAASRKVRDAGFKRWDTITPFPVHGIDEAMGIKPTILPWFTLAAGLTGLTTGVLLQWYTNAYDYPYLISGKPQFSLPANIPVMFELTILFSAFTTLFAMLGLNLLPEFFHPIFRHPRMPRFASDRFAVVIEARDKAFDRERVEALLRSTGASSVDAAFSPEKRAPIPAPILGVGVIIASLLLIPPALVAKSRVSKSEKPRIHIIQDMDMQPKSKAQAPNRLFASLFGDERASVLPPEGTVSRGDLFIDDAVYQGQDDNGNWLTAVPADFTVDQEFLERGQNRYMITCFPCHGMVGAGDGLVAKRAKDLTDSGAAGMAWAIPANLADQRIVDQPIGQIYGTITNGLNNMKGYRSQLEASDRWAIATYVRALQVSQNASLESLSPEQRAELESNRPAGE
jgi:mono/diheme cytochrome c family protein